MIIAILSILVIFAGNILVSQGAFKKGSRKIDLVHLAFVLLIFQIVVTVSVSGILLRNTSWWMLLLLNGLITGGTFVYFRASYRKTLTSVLRPAKQALVNFLKNPLRNKFGFIVIGLFAVLQVLSLSRIALAPPNVFDSQVYHLPISINWFQDGEIELFEDVPVGRFNYATKAPKMLNYWFVAFSNGNINYVELSQYFGLVLLMLSTYGLLRNMKVSGKWSLFAGFLVAFIPIVVIETHTLQDHMLLTALHFALIKLLFDLFDGRFRSESKGIFAVAMTTGLLLAGKFSSPAHIVSIFGVFGLLYFKQILKLVKPKNVPSIIAGIAVAGVVGGIWYALNIYNYGGIFGPPQPQSEKEAILLTNILRVPMVFFESAHRYTPDLINISGYGPFAVTVGLLGSLFAFFTNIKNKKVVGLLASTILLQLMYFSVYLTPYNYRLLIFTPVALIIVSIFYVSTTKSKVLIYATKFLAVVSMLFVLITTVQTDYFKEPYRVWRNYFASYPEDRTTVRLDYTTDKYRRDKSFLFIDQYVPKDVSILYITQHEYGYDDLVVSGYYDNDLNRRAIWGGHITESDLFTPEGVATDLLRTYMKDQGISYIHNNIVFYHKDPVELQPGEGFVQLTENLFYLAD